MPVETRSKFTEETDFDQPGGRQADASAPHAEPLDAAAPQGLTAGQPTSSLGGTTVIISHEKMPTLTKLRSVYDILDFDRAVDDYEASTGTTIDRSL